MTGTISRRKLLLGGAAFLGAGLADSVLRGIPATPFTPSLNFLNSALAAIPRPETLIRASSNENPYGPSQIARQAIADAMVDANKYLNHGSDLIAYLSELEDISQDNIAIGSGSGEILAVGGLMASLTPGSVVCPDPTFGGLIGYADSFGAELIRVPVNANMETDLQAMRSAIRPDTTLVYLCNPNNPIPNLIDRNALRDFVLDVSRDRMVFVDEAYHEFVDDPAYESMLGLIRDGHKNIIVSRTASKIHGLAALRIGFAYSHPDHIADMQSKMTGQLNIAGARAALASYQDLDFQRYTLSQNRRSLDIVEGMCDEMGLRYVKSHANFSFIHTGRNIGEVSAAMREAGILIGRPFPPMLDWARVSMARPEEMQYFVQVYKTLYG